MCSIRQILGIAFVLSTRACGQLGDTVIEVVRPWELENIEFRQITAPVPKIYLCKFDPVPGIYVFFANWALSRK